jgi:lipoprotein-anchoring transpeptidase ErfK/SrfK
LRDRLRLGGARLGVPIGVLLLAAVLVGVWAASRVFESDRAAGSGSAADTGGGAVTAPNIPGVAAEKARTLSGGAYRAQVWAPASARQRPHVSAPSVGKVPVRTPEGTDNIVLALEERPDETGQLWVRVRLAVRPNGRAGWVPRQSLGPYEVLRARLTIDLDRFRATLYKRGKRVFSARVGIGTSAAPTPRGEFYIRNKLTKYSNAFYGPIAFGTSAHSPTLTDWPAGGFVGIHGTNRPDLIPGRISHGCIRMANADILRLARLLEPGTPLRIT